MIMIITIIIYRYSSSQLPTAGSKLSIRGGLSGGHDKQEIFHFGYGFSLVIRLK